MFDPKHEKLIEATVKGVAENYRLTMGGIWNEEWIARITLREWVQPNMPAGLGRFKRELPSA